MNSLDSLTVPPKEAPANSVPAAAVIRRGQALFGITGRKARRWLSKSKVKALGSTGELPLKLPSLSPGGGSRIPSGAVKCVDTGRNTGGEGGSLDRY